MALINLSLECLSPSKFKTTSTRCSKSLGPAIDPSFVTCPTKTKVIDLSFAILINAAAISHTWVTPPGAPSTVELEIV